jgi:DnaK suppressor protein
MFKQNLSGLTEKLQAEQQAILLKLSLLRAELMQQQEADDAIDSASDVIEHEMMLGRIQDLEDRLKLIEFALQQASQGKYGICKCCGQPIDPARLKAIPEATLCIQCKTRGEYDSRRRNPLPDIEWAQDWLDHRFRI